MYESVTVYNTWCVYNVSNMSLNTLLDFWLFFVISVEELLLEVIVKVVTQLVDYHCNYYHPIRKIIVILHIINISTIRNFFLSNVCFYDMFDLQGFEQYMNEVRLY